MIATTSTFFLPIDGNHPLGIRRAPRPLEMRQPGYEEKFDWSTLWYDAFWDPTGTFIVVNGPPLHGINERLEELQAEFIIGNTPLEAHSVRLDNVHEFWLEAEGLENREAILGLRGDGLDLQVCVSNSGCDLFEGLRCVCTVSKDNELAWIKEWLELSVQLHGTEAVLVYDNGSTNYSAEELHSQLTCIQGIKRAVVVRWPFLWGPGGSDPPHQLPWDSNYCQPSALQHARWRFLAKAKSVIQCDIDEVVLCPVGTGAHEICEGLPEGYLEFAGNWCYPGTNAPAGGQVRHGHHCWREPASGKCPTKWAAVPSKILDDTQWQVHRIASAFGRRVPQVEYRHFRCISTSWKYQREMRVDPHNPEPHILDEQLMKVIKTENGDWSSQSDSII